MRSIRLIYVFLLFFLLAVPRLLTGQAPVSDPSESWRVGVAAFDAGSLSSENVYLGSSYPLLIHEALSRIETHTYTDEEIAAYRKEIVAREREGLIRQRDEALVKRDTAFLSGTLSREGAVRAEELAEKIERLNTFNLNNITIQREKPVELVTGINGPLLPAVIGPPEEIAKEHTLDLLVFGAIEEIQSYIFVDVRLYSAAFGELEPLRTGFSRERLTGSSQQVFDSLIRLVLGRDWAEMTVTASVESAEISIDGTFVGTGEATLTYLEPGEHDITVNAFGYSEYSQTVVLSAGDEAEVSAVLTEEEETPISITTVPEGADLYARSRWYGKTPTEISGSFRNLQGTIKKEGYQDFLLPTISPGTNSLDIRLLPEKFDRERVIAHERKDYYKVLAAFILSLPFPVFFFDATNTLTQSYTAEAELSPLERNLDEAYRLLNLRQISLSAYVAATFVSVVLFVDATLELLEYIDRVQLTTY